MRRSLAALAVGASALAWLWFFRQRPKLEEALVRLCAGAPSCAVRLTGDVHDPEGRPLVGAAVRAWRGGDSCSRAAKTDDAGRFEVCAWPGRFWVDAIAGGHARAIEQIEVERTPRRSFELARQLLILGRVADAASGAPLGGADVTAIAGSDPVTVKTDEHGVFRFDHLSGDFLQVHVDAAGHEELIRDVSLTPAWIDARLERSDRERPRPEVRRPAREEVVGTASVSGRVVNTVGAPIFKAELHLDCGAFFRLEHSGWDGRFRFEHLPGNGPCAIRVRADPDLAVVYHEVSPAPEIQLDGPDAHVEGVERVVTVQNAWIAGRVLDERGEPAAGETVHGSQGCMGSSTVTAADGTFKLRSSADSPFGLSIGGALAVQVAENIALGREDVVLQKVATARVEGKLVGFQTPPKIQAWGPRSFLEIPSQDDHFAIDVAPFEPVTLVAEAGNVMDVQTISGTRVVLTARNLVKVTGRVTDLAGRAVPGAVCSLAPYRYGFAADGTFALDAPAGLAVRIECLHDRSSGAVSIRRVPAGGMKDLRVVLRPF